MPRYLNILLEKLKDLTARSVAEKYPDWFQPDPYKLGTFFVKAVAETGQSTG